MGMRFADSDISGCGTTPLFGVSSDIGDVLLVGGEGPWCFAVLDGVDDGVGDERELFFDVGCG